MQTVNYNVSSLKIFIFISIFAGTMFFAMSGCSNEKASKIEEEKKLIGILIGGTQAVTCDTNVVFSALGPAGTTAKCGSCHGSVNPKAGLNIGDYASVMAFVVPRNPASSRLYQSINGGSMTSYSDSNINKIIECWITNGAKEK